MVAHRSRTVAVFNSNASKFNKSKLGFIITHPNTSQPSI
ncbi:uncharacterized protein G2W53_028136 [Senna tora]|uniref:Uncharacterized protein n=1 Tax=Senna tora TaxID=362788 RepID=A0A834T312_9FABA|nr:uncharacterized protein G2W53_028136 [Senna tora]